eukprot:m.107914 g.107914  ORF g.107914 m.107914 type:complete len:444 (-) comp15324_c0_seq2:1769-3100(-)
MLTPVVRKVTLKTSKTHDYGLTFLCMHHDKGPVYISGIASGVSDTLAIGDRVLSVNSVSCKVMSQDTFEEKLRSKSRVVLEVQTDQEGYHQAKVDYHQRIQLSSQDVKEISLPRPHPNMSLGLTLLADVDVPGPVYIGSVELNSTAARAGVTKGHRVVEVNGQDTRMVSEDVLQSAINSSPSNLELKLYFEAVTWHTAADWDPEQLDSDDEMDMDDQVYPLQEYTLHKQDGKFRLNLLSSGTHEIDGVYISAVLNNRARDDGLRRGCRIISINDEDVSSAEKSHVVGLLTCAGESVRIVVKEDPVNFAKFGEFAMPQPNRKPSVASEDDRVTLAPAPALNTFSAQELPETARTSVLPSAAGSTLGNRQVSGASQATTITQDEAVDAMLVASQRLDESEESNEEAHDGRRGLQRAASVDLESRRQSQHDGVDTHDVNGRKESVL